MNKKLSILLSSAAFISGMLFIALYQQWLVVRTPWNTQTTHQPHAALSKRTATLHFWHADSWHQEKTELLWSNDQAHAVYYILTQWLNLLDDERIMPVRVMLQTSLASASGNELYISFDRNPLNKQQSTHEKWMWIEGLLKTLRENGITIPRIHFLVHHQPMHDGHLDFSSPWPLQGFMNLGYGEKT